MKTTKNLSTWLIADLLQYNTPGGHRQYGGFKHVHRVTQMAGLLSIKMELRDHV